MNGDIIQKKLYRGYSIAAAKIGVPFTLYRPNGANNPISTENTVADGVMMAIYQDIKFTQPSKYGNAVWKAFVDGTIVKPFDYLTSDKGTYFIQAMPQTLPVTVVECNHTIKIVRPTQVSGKGAVGYGGNTRATETVLMDGWPCSRLQGSKWERNAAGLPGDERLPWWIVLLPDCGVELRTSDIIIDEYDRRAVISSAENTSYGWRITAGFTGA